MSTLPNTLLQKLLPLVPLTVTVPEVFVAATATFLSDAYDDLEETLNYMKSFKLKSYPGDNVTDCCAEILVDAERLDSAVAFKPEHLGYITRIFEDTSYSIFNLWVTQKYKEVMEFVKKPAAVSSICIFLVWNWLSLEREIYWS